MRYWQFPASYQWSAMPYTVGPTGYPELARLMRAAGESVDMTYGATSSSAATYKIPRALQNVFGYSSADYHDYPEQSSGSNVVFSVYGNGTSTYFDVKDNFERGRPVIFGGYSDQTTYGSTKAGAGDGHNWIGDGYIQVNDQGYGYLRFHMNWGWNGQYNAWFVYNNWTVYTGQSNAAYSTPNGSVYKSYQYCKDVVINIHP